MRKIDLIEVGTIVVCLLFAVVISLYHVSFDGYLGLSQKAWGAIWAIAENGFALALCGVIGIYFSGLMSKVFKFVLMPYFGLKLVYHFSCYSGLYLFSKDRWEDIWSVVLVLLFIVCLAYCLILIKKKHVA